MITSAEEYELLVEHEDSDVRKRAVYEEATEQTWFAILAKRSDLLAEIAMNKKLPSSIINRLITVGCSRTRSLIAMKRALSDEQFARLAGDEDESVRNMIAKNKKTPVTLLNQLTQDKYNIVADSAINQLQSRR
jgi:hypothetical protein